MERTSPSVGRVREIEEHLRLSFDVIQKHDQMKLMKEVYIYIHEKEERIRVLFLLEP
jgi:hypothetical protein